ncbi:MAG: M48 family metallopeptidase [Clostridia bacterium]|nr:M48 family metallopeptidase [Clostridia bacterium]
MIDLNYEVKRSARRSICVRILEDNSIIVTCPKRFSDLEIQKFLASKAQWIERHLAANEQKNEFLAAEISYEKILVKGKEVPLIIDDKGRNIITEKEVRIKSFKNLKKLYITEFERQFKHIIDCVCAEYSFSYKSVSFRDFKSRWGCCNSSGEIKFNWKLLMLSEELWRYVIVHELCHTVYMDHSVKFYRLMESIMPEYKAFKRDLKRFARLTTLY